MKKSTIAGLSISHIVVLFFGLMFGGSLTDTTDLEERITDLETQVTDLQSQITENDVQISALQTQKFDLEQKISERENQIFLLKTVITQKDSEILALQNQASELEQQLEYKELQTLSLQSQISSLEQQLDLQILGIYFSPRGGCEDQVIYWINRANSTVHILIYSFTLDSISDALMDAYNRGVELKIVFEKSQLREYSEHEKLKTAGIDVRNDTNSRLMHNKVMIVDGIIVLTGSFNWSTNAEEYNNENLIIIKSTYVGEIYEEDFEEIWNESV